MKDVSMQQGKHISIATNIDTTLEELLEAENYWHRPGPIQVESKNDCADKIRCNLPD
jgi:hypothetical protein